MEGDSSVNNAYPDITDTFKAIILGVMQNSALTDAFIGTVISESPLEIQLDSKVTLTAPFLVLTNAVKDYTVDVTMNWETEDNTHKHGNGNEGKPTEDHTHKHDITGRKRITIHNGLTKGEEVLLLRLQGGQTYVVLDRLSKHISKVESK